MVIVKMSKARCGAAAALALAASALAGGPGGASQWHFGLPHQPLGDASLSVGPGGGLVVSNIGSSGKDGVAIDFDPAALGGMTGWGCDIEFGNTQSQTNNLISNMQKARHDALMATVFAVFTSTPAGPNTLGLDMTGPPPASAHLELRLDGAIVEAFDTDTPLRPDLVAGPFGDIGTGPLRYSLQYNESDFAFVMRLATQQPLSFDIVGSSVGPTLANEIIISWPELTVMDTIGARITSENVAGDQLQLHSEHLVFAGAVTRGIGNAHLQPGGDRLTVSNIGSSGQDGVGFWLPEIDDEVLVAFSDAPLIGTDAPALLSTFTRFNPDGVPVRCVMNVRAPGAGEMPRLETRFDPSLGATDAVVEVYDKGVFVGALAVPLLPAGITDLGALVPAGPRGGVVDARDYQVWRAVPSSSGGSPMFAMGLRFGGDITLLPNGAPPLVGNEIRLLAQGMSVGAHEMTETGVTAGGIAPFSIGDISIVPLMCPADLNTDSTVNVLDLLVMLGAWGPNPGHAADLNGDGTVNVLDLLAMLGAWGPC